MIRSFQNFHVHYPAMSSRMNSKCSPKPAMPSAWKFKHLWEWVYPLHHGPWIECEVDRWGSEVEPDDLSRPDHRVDRQVEPGVHALVQHQRVRLGQSRTQSGVDEGVQTHCACKTNRIPIRGCIHITFVLRGEGGLAYLLHLIIERGGQKLPHSRERNGPFLPNRITKVRNAL